VVQVVALGEGVCRDEGEKVEEGQPEGVSEGARGVPLPLGDPVEL